MWSPAAICAPQAWCTIAACAGEHRAVWGNGSLLPDEVPYLRERIEELHEHTEQLVRTDIMNLTDRLHGACPWRTSVVGSPSSAATLQRLRGGRTDHRAHDKGQGRPYWGARFVQMAYVMRKRGIPCLFAVRDAMGVAVETISRRRRRMNLLSFANCFLLSANIQSIRVVQCMH